MIYTITALTNDRAMLIEKTAQVANDDNMAQIIIATWESEGFLVKVSTES